MPIVLTAENALPGYPLPDFITFVDNGNGTGSFRFPPGVGDRGDHPLVLTATDDGDDERFGLGSRGFDTRIPDLLPG